MESQLVTFSDGKILSITYDKDVDAMYIQIEGSKKIFSSKEINSNLILDFNKEGGLFGIDILQVSDLYA